jgi:CelD/BcsL family acetyltransferase involved in cellulose biosynthesis
MTLALNVQRVERSEDLAGLAEECRALAFAMQPRLPFAMSDWLQSWWRHFHEDRLLVRDELYVHAVRDERGALLALAPLMVTERPANGPLRCRSIAFFGSDKNVTELRGLICAPEHEAAAVRALLAHLAQRSDEWDWFVWNGVRANSEAHALLAETDNFQWRQETIDYVLPLPATWEEFRATRSRNIKESLRKCYNSLKRAGHHCELRVIEDPAELPAALNRFFELHTLRANAPHLVHHEDVFATPRARNLLLDLATLPSEETSQLRVFQLEIAGSVVASRLGFLMGDELYLYFSGYDPAWSAFSVMTTTVAEAVKWAIERKVRLLNLSPGTDVSKTRWGALPVKTCAGVLLSRRRGARLAFEMLQELSRHVHPGTLIGKVVNVARRHG